LAVALPFFVSEEYFLVIIARGFLPNTADFNRISSVWTKSRYWQDTLAFESPKDPHYWSGSILTSFLVTFSSPVLQTGV
jgi:hypothetical protein